jgi:hypothetical protein
MLPFLAFETGVVNTGGNMDPPKPEGPAKFAKEMSHNERYG